MLLRSPGNSNPLQYSFKGLCRSSCPAAFARPSIYAAKRFSCGPGAERRVPTKQFYIKMFFNDRVVLDGPSLRVSIRLSLQAGGDGSLAPLRLLPQRILGRRGRL